MRSVMDMSSITMSGFVDKRDPGSHFRWNSIKRFVFLACTYSNSVYNFDIFSKTKNSVSFYDFVLLQCVVGTAYIFMDFFMKQYTRKIDAPTLLSPLMRGVMWGMFLQTALWSLYHSAYVADTMRYFFASFRTHPSWSQCSSKTLSLNITCIPSAQIVYKCQGEHIKNALNFRDTSAYHNYMQSFINLNRSALTTKFFSLAIVWLANFFFSTVSDNTLIKIFKLAFIVRTFSSQVILIFLCVAANKKISIQAFQDIFQGSGSSTLVAAQHVAYMYGIGFLGLYDFSCVSVYTMVDNAVIIHSLLFTSMAMVRSWVVRVLFLELTSCVKVDHAITVHYFIFGVLPLSTEFFHAPKLYIFYLYTNVVLSTTAYLIMLTLTMARILHAEFTSVKNMYLVGILCCIGFGLSILIATSAPNDLKLKGLSQGLNVVIFYLGACKAGFIMWIYGVKKFATDIHFWLGFKPTKYWAICWMCLPLLLIVFLTAKIYNLTKVKDLRELLTAIAWIVISVLTVVFSQIKIAAKFLLQNNLVNVLSASKRYGPPDSEDRKRRRNFDETMQLRQCIHNCHAFDEMIDCNHEPLEESSSGNMLFDSEGLDSVFDNRQTPLARLFGSVDVT